MADTKKEHYVPRCYLGNFEGDNNRIYVFDKAQLQIRHQLKEQIAAENYFYDIDFDKIMQSIDVDKHNGIIDDIKRITGNDNWEEIKTSVLDPKHIEKTFFSKLEGEYSVLLKNIISKSYNGNEWVMKNCSPFSEEEKVRLSLFLAVQIIRTRAFRDSIKQIIEKTYQALAYKQQMNGDDPLSKEEFVVEANKDYVKLQHAGMILDEEVGVQISETLLNHIWVMYVNKTNQPFYTSDNPVLTIPHKKNEYISYSGLASEGIEIVFPVSPNLLIAMYDRKWYSSSFRDRSFIPLNDKEFIDYYNQVQVIHSFRCIYSKESNFELANDICKNHPEICDPSNRVEVN